MLKLHDAKCARSYQNATPFLLVDLEIVREKYRRLRLALPDVEIFYAMKANSESRIVQTLVEAGCGVEIASAAELAQLGDLDVPSDKIITSNPIKRPEFLTDLHEFGVRRMAFDSEEEVDKIARYAPDSQLYLRLQVDNSGSDWPLSHKFGVKVSEAPKLLRYAARKGLIPYGLTFHVGSQCRNPQNWANALEACARVIDQLSGQMQLEVINLGGGLPIQHTKQIPELAEVADIVTEARSRLFDNQIRYQIEPGRYLVGDAATLVASVIGKARRNQTKWIYLDVGVFNGLMETVEHFTYEFDFDGTDDRPRDLFTIAGPSCDSMDVMFTEQCIPELLVNERIYIRNAGAYTLSYASPFNGFAAPKVVYTDIKEIALLGELQVEL